MEQVSQFINKSTIHLIAGQSLMWQSYFYGDNYLKIVDIDNDFHYHVINIGDNENHYQLNYISIFKGGQHE
jgi:hypothetical protein